MPRSARDLQAPLPGPRLTHHEVKLRAQFDPAHLDAADASRQTTDPAIEALGSELEALRIDIFQGAVESALPAIAEKLEQVESWWKRHRKGEPVPEARDAEALARTYVGALDIATDAHFAREDWDQALPCIDAMLVVEDMLHRPAEGIGAHRMNRAVVLTQLNRFEEARTELESCLDLFQKDPIRRARTLSALASLCSKQGDLPQAIDLEGQALALRENLASPHDRATSHNNLANHLDERGTLSDREHASHHRLATFLYHLGTDLGHALKTSLRTYALVYHFARIASTPPRIPSVDELLAQPAFDPLKRWLYTRNVDLAALQARVDQLLEMARQRALTFE